MKNIVIRKAVEADISAVYKLVQQLAAYEKEPDAVTATLEDYDRDFEAGLFEVLVAEKGKELVGMALYYMTYSTWKGRMLYLEDFFVRNSYRRQGIGKMLFEAYKKEAVQKGAVLLKWQVLDWNTPAIQFYKKEGAIIERNWLNGKLYYLDKK